MNRDELRNLYRGPSKDAPYQVSIHLVEQFQRRKLKKISQSETRVACGDQVCYWIGTKWAIFIEDLTIDASYQISDQLALRFQRRRLKCEKLTNDRWWTPSDGKSSHCLWQGELKRRLKSCSVNKTQDNCIGQYKTQLKWQWNMSKLSL